MTPAEYVYFYGAFAMLALSLLPLATGLRWLIKPTGFMTRRDYFPFAMMQFGVTMFAWLFAAMFFLASGQFA